MAQFDSEQERIRSMRNYARMLQDQSFQAPQGEMVSGIYVAPSWTQHLANALKGYMGGRLQNQAGQAEKANEEARSEATRRSLAEFLRNAQGAPENAPGDGMGPVQPARQPDMRQAYGSLLNAPSPQLQQMGLQGLSQIPEMEARAAERQQDREMRVAAQQEQIKARAEQLQLAHQQRMEMLQAQNASREQMAQAQRDFMREMAAMRQQAGGGAQPYYQPVQTAQGVFAFNARTGKVEPVMGAGGQPIVGAAADPALQGAIAGAKSSASTEGKATAQRKIEAPQVIAQGEETIRLVDDLLKAPGFKQAVGGSRLLGVQKIPGTSAKDFDVRLDQLKGQQFLQAFESLKGSGQITEIEGKKATDAIARMDAAGSEAEFTKAAREFQSVIRQGVERARGAQGGQAPAAQRKRIRFDANGNIIQ